ncbi:hypothetical protein [Morganella morganii]|uniref:hypothetical protein n=1 Tax=Morganella morganii TaxID=582 RepID=UPI0013B3A0E9|nr:hypothetical protein [Morganella morganii]
MNKLTGMLLLTFALPLTAAAVTPGQCDTAAQDINRQNTFIITGTKYYGPVKSITITSYRSMGLILWVKEKLHFGPCADLTQYDYEYREMAIEEGQVPITQTTQIMPENPDQATITISNVIPGDTTLSTQIDQQYTRNAENRIVSLTESYKTTPDNQSWQSETRYRYQNNRLVSEKETENGETRVTVYHYDADGLLTDIEQPNVMTQEYTYNEQNQVVSVTQKLPTFWGKSTYSYNCYRWDQYGNCELQTMIKAIQLEGSATIQSSGITLESRYEYY